MKLKITDLSYSADDTQILQNIELKVHEGQFVGLIGPNGSGKSTLLRNIYRAVTPARGTILLDGEDLQKLSYRESSLKMSVLRQESNSDFDYTVREIVMMGRSPYHGLLDAETTEDERAVREAIMRVGMEDAAERSIATLSGGEKQRILFARALAQGTDLLILDEPTNHLDIYYKLQIMELVKGLGVTVLSAIHDFDLACHYCDYIYVLNRGRVFAHGEPRAIITPELIASVFRVHAEVSTDPKDGTLVIRYLGTVSPHS